MGRLVREGIRMYRPILLSAWTSSASGVALVFAVLALLGAIDRRNALPWGALILPVYLLHASAVVGWIIVGTELSEHRLRLHALLPLPARQLALAQLLLPASVLLLGVPLAHGATALVAAILGAGRLWVGHALLALIGAHLLLLLQLTLAVKEVIVLRQSVRWKPWFESAGARRRREAETRQPSGDAPPREGSDVRAGKVLGVLGWMVVILLVALEVVLGVPNSTLILVPGIPIGVHNGNLLLCTLATVILAFATAAFTVSLFCRRTRLDA